MNSCLSLHISRCRHLITARATARSGKKTEEDPNSKRKTSFTSSDRRTSTSCRLTATSFRLAATPPNFRRSTQPPTVTPIRRTSDISTMPLLSSRATRLISTTTASPQSSGTRGDTSCTLWKESSAQTRLRNGEWRPERISKDRQKLIRRWRTCSQPRPPVRDSLTT